MFDSVERNLLKTSQRLILGEKSTPRSIDARHGTFHETPLHAAAVQDRKKHLPFATLLINNGADVNAEDRHLAAPLHLAAAAGHGEMAKKLVSCGANVCKEDRWKATALHKAADGGHAGITETLLRNGAGAGARDAWGATPLHRAVARKQLAVAEALLQAAPAGCAEANAEDCSGCRPLHVAARNGDYALAKLLLEHNAAPAARSRLDGKTPEEIARARGHHDVVALLQHRDEWVSVRPGAAVVAV